MRKFTGASMPNVVRLRPVAPPQERRLEALRRISNLLDSAFEVPGTKYRVGLDPIVGLLPAVGDLITPLFTIAVLWQSRDVGVPRVVQVRMLFNAAIDALIGVVPFAGDLFDFAWKANKMNLGLLERHAYEEHSTTGDWLFVVALIVLVMSIAALPFLLAGWLFAAAWRLFA